MGDAAVPEGIFDRSEYERSLGHGVAVLTDSILAVAGDSTGGDSTTAGDSAA